MTSIVEQVFRFGLDNPEKIALRNGTKYMTYKQLLDNILVAKKILSEKYNVKRGCKIIISADKQLEFVPIYFAGHMLEAIMLPIAPDTNAKRYKMICEKTNPSLVIGFDENFEETEMARISDFSGSDCDDVSYPNLDAVADIIFTTGTTGEPKGVQLSHRNIAAAALNINTFIRNSSDDVELLALPISHSFGLGRMRCALSNGQTLVMLGTFANVKRFFRFIEEYKVNGFGMVPASWALLKKFSGNEIEKYNSQLHYIEIGSAPMPVDDKHLLLQLLPTTRICMHYGLTEASRSAFIEFHEDVDHLNTIGRETPNMHISIRDESGSILPPNIEGEICVRGEAVTIGYLNISNEYSFWGDSFRTGDWGMLDDQGFITLKSRKKELINVGGKKVSPIEVEEALKELEFVNDCVCVGTADPDGILGEVVKAFVITDNPEKLQAIYINELLGDRLEGYKHPVIYERIFEVPKTSSGKIQRLSLREKAND